MSSSRGSTTRVWSVPFTVTVIFTLPASGKGRVPWWEAERREAARGRAPARRPLSLYLTLLARRVFYAKGHKWSGLNPESLGVRAPLRRIRRQSTDTKEA